MITYWPAILVRRRHDCQLSGIISGQDYDIMSGTMLGPAMHAYATNHDIIGIMAFSNNS